MSNGVIASTGTLQSRLAAAVDEFLAASRHDRPDIDDFAGRYPELAEHLRQVLPALALLDPAALGSADAADDTTALTGTLGDFRLIREVGRGGMGIVYEAEQISLGRQVALKVLPYAATMDAKQLQRFRNEAKAAASLHHEHIVPVYAVGCERGVHYYAMQFIEGQSLAHLIPALHAQADPPPSPPLRGRRAGGEGMNAAPDATSPYQRAAGAPTPPLAALSTERSGPKGRDFYRTLAQLVVQAADALEHAHGVGIVHRDVKPGNLLVDAAGKLYVSDFGLARFGPDAGLTLSGDLLGTLRYMAPEQAMARHGLVDHRADIYALGATLYELLTGRPAVDATERADMLRQIAFEEPTPPRKLDKAIPAELETITLKCLTKNPAERYATAGELADDLRRWLDHQTIRAKPPTLRQRTTKWARRHRPAVAAAAAGLLLAAAAVGASVAWVVRDAATRQQRTEQAVDVPLAAAEQFQEQALWPEALDAARRAHGLMAGGPVGAELHRRVEQTLAGLELLADLEGVRLNYADFVMHNHFDGARADGEYARVFREAGIDVDVLEPAVAAERIPPGVRVPVAAVLDAWARLRPAGAGRQRLQAMARAADADEWRGRLREAEAKRDRQMLTDLAAKVRPDDDLPAVTLARLGSALREAGAAEDAVALLRRAQQWHPGDFWINHELAWSFKNTRPPRPEEAVRFYTAALALRPASPGAHYNVGLALDLAGDYEGAIAAFRKAIDLKKDYAAAHNNLGAALSHKGDHKGAIPAFRESLRLRPDDALTHYNLGGSLEKLGDLDEAVAAYRETLRLRPDDALTLTNLGDALRRKGDLDGAIAACRAALRLKPDLAEAHDNLGIALGHKGDNAGAIAAHREAIRLKPDLAGAHLNLGVALEAKGDRAGALAAHREAIRLKPDFDAAHDNLGTLLFRQGDHAGAIAAHREAIRLKPNLAAAHQNLGSALREHGKVDEAIASYREALRLNPDNAIGRNNLGIAFAMLNKLDDAIACWKETVRRTPDFADAHHNLGRALAMQGKRDEALAAFREAIRLKPDFAIAHYNLGMTLRDKGDLDGAIAALREALRLQPADHSLDNPVGAYNNLGTILEDKGDLDGAIAAYHQALRLKPDHVSAHYNLGIALKKKGDLDGAVAAYRQAIRLKPDYVEAHVNLSLTLGIKGDSAGAIAAGREALRLKPDFAEAHNCLAWHLATCLDLGLRDPREAVAHARKAVELAAVELAPGGDGSYWSTLGVAHYRNGEWQAAVEALTKSTQLRQSGDATDFFFLAMARWQLGDKEQAREWYDKAVAWMDKHDPRDAELLRFRAEAVALLGIPDPPKDQ